VTGPKPVVAVAAVIAAALVTGVSAFAGTYEVQACSNAIGPVQTTFIAAADRGMAAYSACPNSPSNPA
jgi:hypothetical protein